MHVNLGTFRIDVLTSANSYDDIRRHNFDLFVYNFGTIGRNGTAIQVIQKQ
jgi:hypothetical protein